MRLPGDAKDSGEGMGMDIGKEKKDAENAESREIEQELRRRLRSLDREIPVPDKASAEQLLYRLQAQNGRKRRIPSWARTLGLGLACCFVAVFGLWGSFSGAFGALLSSKDLAEGENSTLQGYRTGDPFASSAAMAEESGSELANSSGSFLIESVTYSGMTDGGDLYYISRSYSDLQKLLYSQDGSDGGAEKFSTVTDGEVGHAVSKEQAYSRHLFGEGGCLFYQAEGGLYQLNTEDNSSIRLMDLTGELKLAKLDNGFLLLAVECQGTRPDGQSESVICSSVYAEGAYEAPLASRVLSGSLLDMALVNGRVVVLTEKRVSAQSPLEELTVYAGDTPQQMEEVSSSMAFVLPIQDADRFTIMSTLPLNSSEESLCRFVVGRELTADLRDDGIYLFSDSRWSVCMVRFQADAQLSFYDAKVLPGSFGGRYYTNGKDNRWLLVEEEGTLKAYQLMRGLSNSIRGSFSVDGALTDAAVVSHYLYFSNGTCSWRVDLNGFMRQEDLTTLHYGATSIHVLGSKLLLYDAPGDILYLADVEQTDKWVRLSSDSGDELWAARWLNADLLREKSDNWGELVAVRDGDALEVYEMDGIYLNLLGRYQTSELLLSDAAAEEDVSLGNLYLWQNNAVHVLEMTGQPSHDSFNSSDGADREEN